MSLSLKSLNVMLYPLGIKFVLLSIGYVACLTYPRSTSATSSLPFSHTYDAPWATLSDFFSLMHVKPILLPSVHPNHFCLISFAFTTFNHRLLVIHVWAQIIGGITFVKICRHFFLCRTLHILPNVMKYLFLTERNWMNSMKKLSPHRLNRHIFFFW